MHSIDFHAHHSPQGAYATFTCGRHGAGGGFTIEGARPAAQDLLIGWMEDDGTLHALPFFTGATQSLENYVAARGGQGGHRRALNEGLTREYGASVDRWRCGDLAFAIHTPVVGLPDPDVAGEAALQRAILPVVVATLHLDNRRGATERTLVFAVAPGIGCYRLDDQVKEAAAVGWGREFGIASPRQPGLHAFVHWTELDWFRERRDHLLGGTCGLALTVPPGEERSLQIVIGFCRQGVVTTGIEASYFYTRAYPTLGAVLAAGIDRAAELRTIAKDQEAALAASPLDEHQRFLWAHAERSYWGNTQLLAVGGRALWVVLEGEYAMINTFDLTVDMCFYELSRNAWVVRNVLDQFVERYSYVDRLARPAEHATRRSHEFSKDPRQLFDIVPRPAETGLPGGISFCHDMGVQGHFTPPGSSSYEVSALAGCFSYMTCEQLYNWICTATSYVCASGDQAWLERRRHVIEACLQSALNRDDPVPQRRNGINSLDSARLEGGWEITTYDSLDPSLGQARNNLYMATKAWACWLGLAHCFELLGDGARRDEAMAQAGRAAATIAARFDAKLGYIPAVFEGGNASAIIPAIEGLVFPLVWKLPRVLDRDGPWRGLLDVLDRHLRAVLREGVCIYPDGGWQLSSTSDNSWLSKIFLCQHVAERVFGIVPEPRSHAAHARWQQVGSADWAMSDQCFGGIGKASKYYPRCVTADLWLA